MRRTLVADIGVHSVVEDRIYPEDNKLTERLKDSKTKYPLVTFVMTEEADKNCGIFEGLIQVDVVHRDLDKKTLWDVFNAVETALVPPKAFQAAIEAALLPIRVSLFRQQGAADDVYDSATDTYRLRTRWRVIYLKPNKA